MSRITLRYMLSAVNGLSRLTKLTTSIGAGTADSIQKFSNQQISFESNRTADSNSNRISKLRRSLLHTIFASHKPHALHLLSYVLHLYALSFMQAYQNRLMHVYNYFVFTHQVRAAKCTELYRTAYACGVMCCKIKLFLMKVIY